MKYHKFRTRERDDSAWQDIAKFKKSLQRNIEPKKRPAIYYLNNVIKELDTESQIKIAKHDTWARRRSNQDLYKWEENRGWVINHDVSSKIQTIAKVLKGKKIMGSGISPFYDLGELIIKKDTNEKILDRAKSRIGGKYND